MSRLRLTLAALAALVALLALATAPRAEDRKKGKDKPAEKDNSPAAKLRPFVENKTTAGAVVLVANKDRVLALEAVGYADLANKEPMRPDSLFWIESMSKAITATALMILVDDGKVKIDDPVEKYLPEFEGQWQVAETDREGTQLRKPKGTVLVRHLLTHTSGMPLTSKAEKPTLDALTLEKAVQSYVKTPLLCDPGTEHHYSNAGINTVGRIIEVVSKTPYEKFLQERLLDPLKMKDTTFWPTQKQLDRLARAYRPNKARDGLEETKIAQLSYPLSDRKKRQPVPACGLFSTAADLSNFCRMILNGGKLDGKRYLSEKAVEQMTSNQVLVDGLPGWGLGWSVGREGEPFGHAGAFATRMQIDPKAALVLVYLIQASDGYPNKDGDEMYPTFANAAKAKYGKK
jgi:CubicO group peptidase (beta-lactamase class C family)